MPTLLLQLKGPLQSWATEDGYTHRNTGSLFGAIVSWAWKKAHYGLLKKGWIAEDYDEDSREWTTRPGAERLAAALTRSGEYRMLPCFGWMILIVRDHKNERHDEKRN